MRFLTVILVLQFTIFTVGCDTSQGPEPLERVTLNPGTYIRGHIAENDTIRTVAPPRTLLFMDDSTGIEYSQEFFGTDFVINSHDFTWSVGPESLRIEYLESLPRGYKPVVHTNMHLVLQYSTSDSLRIEESFLPVRSQDLFTSYNSSWIGASTVFTNNLPNIDSTCCSTYRLNRTITDDSLVVDKIINGNETTYKWLGSVDDAIMLLDRDFPVGMIYKISYSQLPCMQLSYPHNTNPFWYELPKQSYQIPSKETLVFEATEFLRLSGEIDSILAGHWEFRDRTPDIDLEQEPFPYNEMWINTDGTAEFLNDYTERAIQWSVVKKFDSTSFMIYNPEEDSAIDFHYSIQYAIDADTLSLTTSASIDNYSINHAWFTIRYARIRDV